MPGLPKIIFFAIVFYILHATGLLGFFRRLFDEVKKGMAQADVSGKSAGDAEVCYRLLGVTPSAKWEEIEKAYRSKAKVHHPDLGGDEDAMRALNEAYNYIKKLRKG